MDYGAFRYEEPYSRPRRRINYFAWTVAILLLTGVTLAAWLGSFYIFDQPERPDSYKILQRLHKIEPPKRFELTAAPGGEFLTPKQLYDRYVGMGAAELAKANAELARNYIRNYQQVRGLVPYVVGRYAIMSARELGPNDLFTSGMVALTNAVDSGELLMEHLLLKAQERSAIEQRYADYRQKIAANQGPIPIPGLSPSATPPPAENELVRVEQAKPVEAPAVPPVSSKSQKLAKATPVPKGGKLAKKQKLESPPSVATPAKPVIAQKSPGPTSTPLAVASAPTPAKPPVATATATIAAVPSPSAFVAASQAPVFATVTPLPVLPALPVPANASGVALASNVGGGSWKTFPAGKMPLGRLIGTDDLRDVVEHGLAGERVYLRGQFVVNFSDPNRAVLRPRTKLTDKVLHFGAGSSTRIIVEFPAGYTPPQQGAVVNRDEMRPYEITEVRKQEDGQLNVFVREIMQPQ